MTAHAARLLRVKTSEVPVLRRGEPAAYDAARRNAGTNTTALQLVLKSLILRGALPPADRSRHGKLLARQVCPPEVFVGCDVFASSLPACPESVAAR